MHNLILLLETPWTEAHEFICAYFIGVGHLQFQIWAELPSRSRNIYAP